MKKCIFFFLIPILLSTTLIIYSIWDFLGKKDYYYITIPVAIFIGFISIYAKCKTNTIKEDIYIPKKIQ